MRGFFTAECFLAIKRILELFYVSFEPDGQNQKVFNYFWLMFFNHPELRKGD
jgi:hypothetical protein